MFNIHLKKDEQVKAFYRQTETILILPTLAILAGIYIPFAFLLEYGLVHEYRIILLVWTFLLITYVATKFLMWRLAVAIITNERVITVQYQSLFKRNIREVSISQIAAINYKATGIASTLLKYGTIELHIIGIPELFTIERLNNPQEVKELLQQLQFIQQEEKQQIKNPLLKPANIVINMDSVHSQLIPKPGDLKIYTKQAQRKKIV